MILNNNFEQKVNRIKTDKHGLDMNMQGKQITLVNKSLRAKRG